MGNEKSTNCIFCFFTFILLCIFLLTAFQATGSATVLDKKPPFQPGEKYTYSARWGVLRAGEVTLEVLPMETINSVRAFHFAMVTKTNRAIDLVYKIREQQDSYISIDMTHSVLYKKRNEGNYPRDVVIDFDWEKLEATRSNFGEKMAPIAIVPGTFDPLALFFIIRLQDFKKSPVIEIPLTEGDKNIRVKATVAQKEKIEIGERAYETFKVVPDMELLAAQDVGKSSDEPQLIIWFTADDKKLPVRIQSKAKVGYFVFDLMTVEP